MDLWLKLCLIFGLRLTWLVRKSAKRHGPMRKPRRALLRVINSLRCYLLNRTNCLQNTVRSTPFPCSLKSHPKLELLPIKTPLSTNTSVSAKFLINQIGLPEWILFLFVQKILLRRYQNECLLLTRLSKSEITTLTLLTIRIIIWEMSAGSSLTQERPLTNILRLPSVFGLITFEWALDWTEASFYYLNAAAIWVWTPRH